MAKGEQSRQFQCYAVDASIAADATLGFALTARKSSPTSVATRNDGPSNVTCRVSAAVNAEHP